MNEKIGSISYGLRSILRQDPDVIMVGEIRDLESLRMAIQSALTGHLVLTTVHCNDAAAAPPSGGYGAEPFLVASAARSSSPNVWCGAFANSAGQKPARKKMSCKCSKQGGGSFYEAEDATTAGHRVLRPHQRLRNSHVNDTSLRITARNGREIRHLAAPRHAQLRDDAVQKAREGITTLEEVVRAVWVVGRTRRIGA